MKKYICKACKTEAVFETEKDAWIAGWDIVQKNKEIVCFCDKCPASPHLLKEDDYE